MSVFVNMSEYVLNQKKYKTSQIDVSSLAMLGMPYKRGFQRREVQREKRVSDIFHHIVFGWPHLMASETNPSVRRRM